MMCMGREREYSPCISACPKTCSNYETYSEVSETCEYACVEGCDCPSGYVRITIFAYNISDNII